MRTEIRLTIPVDDRAFARQVKAVEARFARLGDKHGRGKRMEAIATRESVVRKALGEFD